MMPPVLLRAALAAGHGGVGALPLVVVALLSAVAVWQVQSWRMHTQQAEAQQVLAQWQAQAQQARAQALEAVRALEQQHHTQLEDAKNEHQAHMARVRADGVAARAELERLRERLAQPAPALPGGDARAGAAACGGDDAAVRDLLGACAQAYLDVAQQADRHAADARLLFDGWPR